MPEAIYRGPGDEIPFTATSDLASGSVLEKGGIAGVVDGLNVKNGDSALLRVKGRFDVASASATTFAEGATVQFNDTTKLAVASGDFALGKAAKAKASGDPVVSVIFNE